MTTGEQLRYSYKDLLRQGKRMGKQLALFGGVYGTIECFIERWRGKQDMTNHLITGCAVGGGFGSLAGPSAACMGCLGFTAFGYVIEKFMEPEEIGEDEMYDEINHIDTSKYHIISRDDFIE